MADEKNVSGAGDDDLSVNEETLKDLDLSEESDAEDVAGGGPPTEMCSTKWVCRVE